MKELVTTAHQAFDLAQKLINHFEVARNPQDHVGFGYGIHYCLGAPLARLEGRIALEALLFDCPPFTWVLAQVPRIAAYLVRGPQTLPLRFETTM